MQETRLPQLNEQQSELMKEFFTASTDSELLGKMNDRLGELEENGHTLTRRTYKIGRNDPCPCGSGKKFKRCHLNDVA